MSVILIECEEQIEKLFRAELRDGNGIEMCALLVDDGNDNDYLEKANSQQLATRWSVLEQCP